MTATKLVVYPLTEKAQSYPRSTTVNISEAFIFCKEFNDEEKPLQKVIFSKILYYFL